MNIWIDAQLSPSLAPWISDEFGVDATALKTLGLRDASDHEIFVAAGNANAIVVTKDSDFLHLLDQHGPPPQILWITCGNTSNAFMQAMIRRELRRALELFAEGERLVEIRQ